MSDSVKATKKALNDLVEPARVRKGWNKTDDKWIKATVPEISLKTLQRFWDLIPIRQANFIAICLAVGIEDWTTIADISPINKDSIEKIKQEVLSAESQEIYEAALNLWYQISIDVNFLKDEKLKNKTKKEVIKAVRELYKKNTPSIAYNEFQETIDCRQLKILLTQNKWQKADELTTEILFKSVNLKTEELISSEQMRQIPSEQIQAIDNIWKESSGGIYGFSVQRKIWELLGGNIESNYDTWKQFGDIVGWRKGTEYDDWRWYDDIKWTKPEETLGHLPLAPAGILMWNWGFFSLGSFWNVFMDELEIEDYFREKIDDSSH